MHTIPLDYETLRLIWWLLLGVLLIGFALMDGYDLGVGALLPFVAKTDEERRVLINLVGPTWEGNQVWLILGGGAIFAAWPPLYAASFSGFYLAMIAILLALILRPVGFKFRGKAHDPRWREAWDWALFVGGFVPALIFGVAVGNLFLGVPHGFDPTLRPIYEGGTFLKFFGLLRPFALLAGLVSLTMLVAHGAAMITLRCHGPVTERARLFGATAAAAALVLFAIGGGWIALMDGYVYASVVDPQGPSNPLGKTVSLEAGAWLGNFAAHSWMIAAPVAAAAGLLVALLGFAARRGWTALAGTSLGVAGIIATAGLSLFPFLLPSNLDPAQSLTVWDASSSQLTLFVMLLATAIFLPLILAYTAWVFRVMRGTVTPASIDRNPNAY